MMLRNEVNDRETPTPAYSRSPVILSLIIPQHLLVQEILLFPVLIGDCLQVLRLRLFALLQVD